MKITIAVIVLIFATVQCSLPTCTKQDGGWSSWLRWGPCTVSCGTGTQIRHRYCDNPVPKNGGLSCSKNPTGKTQSRQCVMEDCPPNGIYEEEKTKCSRPCGGGSRTVKYVCKAPPTYGTASCYKDCPYKADTTETCNIDRCNFPPRDACSKCKEEFADRFASSHGANFVGFACRVSPSICSDSKGGIRDMYPANDWYFIHCSPDGPWCKPCATRTLVYNKHCGQCEAPDAKECTGPNKRQDKRQVAKDLLSDDDLW